MPGTQVAPRGTAMTSTRFALIRRTGGYVLGAMLTLFGVCGLIGDAVAAPSESDMVYFSRAFCGVMILCGVGLCLGTWRRYEGGSPTFIGVTLVGVSVIFAGILLDGYVQEHRLLLNWFAVAGFVFVLGDCFLVAGHLRHQCARRAWPPNEGAPPNGGPAEGLGNSGISGRPPSVS